jgi:hypothetical protein
MQDFTGVPAIVDLADTRDAMEELGGDPKLINPFVPVELVIDHARASISPAVTVLPSSMRRRFSRRSVGDYRGRATLNRRCRASSRKITNDCPPRSKVSRAPNESG